MFLGLRWELACEAAIEAFNQEFDTLGLEVTTVKNLTPAGCEKTILQ
jgi:hypothetical protein